MYRVGRVPDHVQRSYTEQNRWMYVAPVRGGICLRDLVKWFLIALAFCALLLDVAVAIVLLTMV